MREECPNTIKHGKRKVTISIAEIQRVIRDNCEQLDINKMDNLEEMDKFLEIKNLSKLNHDEIENLNRPIKVRRLSQ